MTPTIHRSAALPPRWRIPFTTRSLTLKLTLAFLIVGLTGALLVSFFVGLGTQRAFDQFVTERGLTTLKMDLAQYYQATGTWTGVASVVERYQASHTDPRGRQMPPTVLASADGQVILGSDRYPVGMQVSAADRLRSEPIVVGSTVIGWLLPPAAGGRPGPGSPEADFYERVARATTYSAVGATVIALLLGVVLARTLTNPVRELTAATQAVAKGALGRQVRVRSRDELGVLAGSFNQMSTDLAHASALRRQMTADIAHDLRTPLSVILGYTEALREGKLAGDQDIFDTLHTEAQHLQHLIDDLRTLSLADAGELPLMRQPVAPQSLLERTAAAYRAQAQARGITLVVCSPVDVPEIDVDPERMAQVLNNLISNAVRYTPAQGTITLKAEVHGNNVQLVVQDTGMGIAPADLPHVFERFYRADPARQHGDGSSGLGLAIAKGIVAAHRGSIAVASTKGMGTTFTITLPQHPVTSHPGSPERQQQ